MSNPRSTVAVDGETPAPGHGGAPAESAPGASRGQEPTASDLDVTLEQELESLRDQLQEQQRVAAEAQDNFLRARADIDNYRRRARQEMEDVRRYGIEELVVGLLPVLDNFERALEAAHSTPN